MTSIGRRVETSTATIERVASRFIEQRYRTDAHIAPGVFEQNRKARWKIAGGTPCVLMIVIPPELALHTPSTNQDHFRADSEARSIIALAVVAQNMAVYTAAKFYFRYYAQSFEARVFEEEEEARRWLTDMLEQTAP